MPQSRMAIITFMEGGDLSPDQGLPGGGGYPSQGLPGFPGHPSQGLPISPGHPSQGLPGGGHITTLPVFPFDPTKPDQGLPGQGGERPEQGLPGIRPGAKFVVKWLACYGFILVPDNSLPGGEEEAEPR